METAFRTKDYTGTITVSATPKEVFDALTARILDWWTQTTEGNAGKISDVFTVRFGKTYKTFKVTDLVPNDTVVWQCIDSYINATFFQNKKEWTGTKIVWEIFSERHSTHLRMTHIGLNPGIECYDVCEKGWGTFMNESLYKLLNTGKGLPFGGIK
jgi:Activator of Hsp90 ATPase homolog 1-like protein